MSNTASTVFFLCPFAAPVASHGQRSLGSDRVAIWPSTKSPISVHKASSCKSNLFAFLCFFAKELGFLFFVLDIFFVRTSLVGGVLGGTWGGFRAFAFAGGILLGVEYRAATFVANGGLGVDFKAVLLPSIGGGAGVNGDHPNTLFATASNELSIAGGTGVGLPPSYCSLDTTIGSRGKESIFVGGDVLGLLTKDGFSNLLGFSVLIGKAFEFGLVPWNKGAKLGATLEFEGAMGFSLGLLWLVDH
jgi:hypothetical protein